MRGGDLEAGRPHATNTQCKDEEPVCISSQIQPGLQTVRGLG